MFAVGTLTDRVTSSIVTMGILIMAGAALNLLSSRPDDPHCQWLSMAIIPLTVLISIFHAVYDGLLLVARSSHFSVNRRTAYNEASGCGGYCSCCL